MVEALALAVDGGLRLPIVYNSSAYDAIQSLRLMEGLVDIYMPDFKFWERSTARKMAHAEDYPEVAKAAIAEMHRQVGDLCFNERGLAVRGLLVRHLVMPGQVAEAASIMRWIGTTLSPDTFVNIMDQYRPTALVGKASKARPDRIMHGDINRPTTVEEFAAVESVARAVGLRRFNHEWPVH